MALMYLQAEQHTINLGKGNDGNYSRNSTSTSWRFGEMTLNKDLAGDDYLSIEVGDSIKVGDVVYATVAVWSSGDSFASYKGEYAEIFSVHKDAATAVKAKNILSGIVEDYDYRPTKEKKGTKFPVDLGDGYQIGRAPWLGYFESLDSVDLVFGMVF